MDEFPNVAALIPADRALEAADEAAFYGIDFATYEQRKAFIAELRNAFPDAFAKREFDSSGDAYNAANSNEAIASGDMLIVAAEKAIALAWAWPVQIAGPEESAFHGYKDPGIFAEFASVAQVRAAIDEAKARGWEIVEGLEAWLNANDDAARWAELGKRNG